MSSRWEIGADAGCSATASHSRLEMGNTTLHGHESLGGRERSRMNTRANNFSAPLRGAEHHQSYASTNVRKILDTTEIGISEIRRSEEQERGGATAYLEV
jgi:hypothetical protein